MKQTSKIYNQETNRVIDNNGFLYVKKSPLLRAGILEYYGEEFELDKIDGEIIDKDKVYKVYVPIEEIKKAVEGFKNKPITLEHEWLGNEGTDSKGYQVGNTGEQIFIQDNMIFSNLEITSQEAIEEIENGNKAELSASYEQSFKKAPNDAEYDFIATDIRPNHIALVEKGRCGSGVRVYNNLLTKGKKTMDVKLTIDGNDIDLTEIVSRRESEVGEVGENANIEPETPTTEPKEAVKEEAITEQEEPTLDFDGEGEKTFVGEENKTENEAPATSDSNELARQIIELAKKFLKEEQEVNNESNEEIDFFEETKDEPKEDDEKVENNCSVKANNYDKVFNHLRKKVKEEFNNKIRAFNSVKNLVNTDYDFYNNNELDIYNEGLKTLGLKAGNVEEAKGMIKAYNSVYKMDETFSYDDLNGNDKVDINI